MMVCLLNDTELSSSFKSSSPRDKSENPMVQLFYGTFLTEGVREGKFSALNVNAGPVTRSGVLRPFGEAVYQPGLRVRQMKDRASVLPLSTSVIIDELCEPLSSSSIRWAQSVCQNCCIQLFGVCAGQAQCYHQTCSDGTRFSLRCFAIVISNLKRLYGITLPDLCVCYKGISCMLVT